MNHRPICLGLVLLSCLLFGAGIPLPLFRIEPSAGEWTHAIRILSPGTLSNKLVTLPGGIVALWDEGEFFLFAILCLFSLVLPILKLCVLWWEGILPDTVPAALLRTFRLLSRYAMVEVFVVSLVVILIKGLPGGSQVTLQAGTYAFSLSVILSMIASQKISPP